jgi:hypothetical protein
VSGDWLAMGAVAALALVSARRRGSRSELPTVKQARRFVVEQASRVAHAYTRDVLGDWAVPDVIQQRYWDAAVDNQATYYEWNDALEVLGEQQARTLYGRALDAFGSGMGGYQALYAQAQRGSAQRQVSEHTITRAGFPWPAQTMLYHGTYAMQAIERQGFRTRRQGAVSMAGGGHTRSVSATLLPQRAAAIALGLDTLARVAQRDLSLSDLVYRLEDELGTGEHTGLPLMVDVLTAFTDWVRSLAGTNKPYTIEAYHAILGNLDLIDQGWVYVSLNRQPPEIGKPYVLPRGAIEIEGHDRDYLVPAGSRLPLSYDVLVERAERQIANPSDRGAWAWKRAQGYAYGRCDAAFRIYKGAVDYGGGYRTRRTFNPLFMDTDVAALAKVPRSSIGVIELRSSVPRICTDERGAIRLGYLERSDRTRDDKMRGWHNDCQHVLDFPRSSDADYTEKKRTAQLLGLWDDHLRRSASWQGWSVQQQGARMPQTTMLYVDGEEEVRIYDTSQIEVAGHLSMRQIRERFGLGDRLTWPWFDPKEVDVRVWRRPTGSPNVVTDSGYHRTAIAGQKPSAPLRHLLEHHSAWVKGKVLDFGTGRGRDCKALSKRRNLSVSCYDPHHPQATKRKLPSGKFDLVLATYVVNVLPKAERRKAIAQMAAKVKKGGRLVVAARGCGDRQGVQTARQWGKHSDGFGEPGSDGTLERFQRFYTDQTLRNELRDILGSTFSPLSCQSMPADTALAVFQRS